MEVSISDITRLEGIAAHQYPIPEKMCAFKKQSLVYKRNAFVWRLKKDFLLLTEVQKEMVLNELERKTKS